MYDNSYHLFWADNDRGATVAQWDIKNIKKLEDARFTSQNGQALILNDSVIYQWIKLNGII